MPDWYEDTDERSTARDALIAKLRKRVESWKNNTDEAWVKVRVGELRAVLEELDMIVDHNEDMAMEARFNDRD